MTIVSRVLPETKFQRRSAQGGANPADLLLEGRGHRKWPSVTAWPGRNPRFFAEQKMRPNVQFLLTNNSKDSLIMNARNLRTVRAYVKVHRTSKMGRA
jgi:hypothetical protein